MFGWCDPDRPDMFKTAEGLRNSSAFRSKGLSVRDRRHDQRQPQKSGKIEGVVPRVEGAQCLGRRRFQLDDDSLSETTRLTHRVAGPAPSRTCRTT